MLPLSLSLLLLLAPLATPTPINAGLSNLDLVELSAPDFHKNRVLLIRHGEKPPNQEPGLSLAGKKRAQCLRTVFGDEGKHNIGMIISQAYNKESGVRMRPYLTVKPLAKDLGLPVDVSCERDDASCVRKLVKKFAKHSDKDVLICWKHSFLGTLAHALGAEAKNPYPDDRYDILWIMKDHRIISKESEKCDGLDDDRGRYDPDLEIPADDGKVHHDGDGDERVEDSEQLSAGSEQVRFRLEEMD